MSNDNQQALEFAAWSRVWSPLVEDVLRKEAWQGLELPGDFDEWVIPFTNTFHAGAPAPPVALLMHASLGLDGSGVREDFVRVMSYLGVGYEDQGRLPPDHLACACELVALALEAGETVLVTGLRDRYLLPWLQAAHASLAGNALDDVVAVFAEDVAMLPG